MFSTELTEFIEVLMVSGLIAVAALATASVIGFTLAFRVFREHVPVATPIESPADAARHGQVLASPSMLGRPIRESHPVAAG